MFAPTRAIMAAPFTAPAPAPPLDPAQSQSQSVRAVHAALCWLAVPLYAPGRTQGQVPGTGSSSHEGAGGHLLLWVAVYTRSHQWGVVKGGVLITPGHTLCPCQPRLLLPAAQHHGGSTGLSSAFTCTQTHSPVQPLCNPQHHDVWNEILHTRAFLDACGLWGTTVRDAFRWAHTADPTAKLCINE